MNWLPLELPSNVTLLLSVMPGFENILDRLQARLRPASFVELAQFTPERAATVFKNLLQNGGRTLNEDQEERAVLCLKHSPTPLLIHLTVLEARRWHSFTPEDKLKLGNSAREAVQILFDRLERDHGMLLVSHALSYVVLSKNGLTEKEMEEVLSLDNEVMNDVYQYWPPPSDHELRIPPAIWARLRQDMADFIMNRQADGKTVIGIYHKQFTEVIRSRYLSDTNTNTAVLNNLIEYFSGTWAGKAKPIQMKILKESQAKPHFRKVRAQPLRFGKNQDGRYNLRKMSELPYLLICSKDFDSVKSDCLLNFQWIQAKHEACGMTALLEDFSFYQSEQKGIREDHDEDRPVALVAKALRMSRSTLEYSDCEDILATEIIGRCSDLVDEISEIKLIVESARKWCSEVAPKRLLLVPENQTFIRPNGALLTTLSGHNTGITCMASTEDNKFLITAGKDWALRIWDLETDSIMHILELKGYPETIAIDGVSDTFYVLEADGSISSYHIKSGSFFQKLPLRDLYESFSQQDLQTKPLPEPEEEKPKPRMSFSRRQSTKSLLNSESSVKNAVNGKRMINGRRDSKRSQTSSGDRSEKPREEERIKTGYRRASTAKSMKHNSRSPEKSRKIPLFKSDTFEKMEKFKKLTDSKTICKFYHSTMIVYWGGHLFLFDTDDKLKLIRVFSPEGRLVSWNQYHEALILTFDGRKVCYVNMKTFEAKTVTYGSGEFSNILGIIGIGVQSEGTLTAVVNQTDGSKILRLGFEFGQSPDDSTNDAQVFDQIFCDGLATKAAFHKTTVAIAGRKCFSISKMHDKKSSEIKTQMVKLEADICALELLSGKKGNDLNVLVVGSKDESVRVYDCETVTLRNYLPGIWGPPEIIFAMGANLYTGTSSAQFVKVWNLKSEENSDVPIHFNSFHVQPICAWSEKENSFLAASSDIEGKIIYIANSSGIVDEIPIPDEHCPIEGLLLLSKDNQIIFANKAGDIYKTTYEPMKAEPNQSFKLIAEFRNQVRHYHYSADLCAALLLLDTDRVVKFDLSKLHFEEIPVSTDIVPDQPPIPVISILTESANRRSSTVPENQGHLAAVAICEYGNLIFRRGNSCLLLKPDGEIIRRFLFEFGGIFVVRGKLVAVQTGEEEIQILDLSDADKAPVVIEYGTLPITCLELSPDNQLLLLGTGNAFNLNFGQRQIRIYDTKDGIIVRRKAYMYSPVTSLTLLSSELMVACLKVGYFAIFKIQRPTNWNVSTKQRSLPYGSQYNNAAKLTPARNFQRSKRSAACNIL